MIFFGQTSRFRRLPDGCPVLLWLKDARLLGAILLLGITAPPALGQEVETYSGRGTAILGTGMTMEQTRRLALEAARRNALQKFGSYVRSEETLRRFSGENVNRETFVQETKVISASVIRLKEDTKEVTRKTEGKTIRFVVRAKFEIDKNKFNKRLKQYQNAPKESRVRQLVDRGVRIESKIQKAKGVEERQRLTGKRLKLRKQIRQSLQRLDGSQALTDIVAQRDRRRRALKRHLRFIKNNLHPYSIAKIVPQSEPKVTDQGEYVEISAKYKVRLKKGPDWALAIGDTLRTLTRSWYSEEGWNPVDPRLIGARFECAFVGTSASGQIVFVDDGGSIGANYSDWPLGDRPRRGISEDGEYYLNEAKQEAVTAETFEFRIGLPPSIVKRVENINLVITRFGSMPTASLTLTRFVKSKGFEITTNDNLPLRTYVNPSGADVQIEDITIGDSFEKYLDLVAKASKEGQSWKKIRQQARSKDP